MTGKEYRYVLDTIDNEGFDYTFQHYSNFDGEGGTFEVKDPTFHALRKAFLEARKALADYIGAEDR